MNKLRIVFLFVVSALTIWAGVYTGFFYSAGRGILRYNMLASAKEYNKKSYYYSDIYYSEGSGDYIALIGTNMDYFFSLYKRDFNLAEPGKASIILYPDKYALSEAIGVDYSNKPPLGVYYAGVISLMSPETVFEGEEAQLKDDFLKNGPVAHEAAHYFLDLKTKGNYEPWFSEGIALFYEYKYAGFEWRPDLKGASEGVDMFSMNREFKKMDQAYGYRCAFEIICNITEVYGEPALTEIFDELEKGRSLKSILKAYEN